MLAGDWTTFASAGCNGGRGVTLKAPLFVNNRIDPARFSQAAVKIVGSLPQGDECGLFNYGQGTSAMARNSFLRMDHKLSNNHTLFDAISLTASSTLAHLPVAATFCLLR
jgi:hypothetical protein